MSRILRRPRPSHVSLAAGVLACAGALLACNTSDQVGPPSFGGASAPLSVSCLPGSGTALVGSAPIQVSAQVTRGGSPVAGQTVTFRATGGGSIQPTSVATDTSGFAVAFFQPPATPASVTILTTVTDRSGGDASSACAIAVTQPRNPQLSVQLLSPSQAAGLNVRVRYDASKVRLPAGGAHAAGPFTDASCVQIANDDSVGVVTFNLACPTDQQAAGTVAAFAFQHVAGAEAGRGDFSVDCTSFDQSGAGRTAVCDLAVTQL